MAFFLVESWGSYITSERQEAVGKPGQASFYNRLFLEIAIKT